MNKFYLKIRKHLGKALLIVTIFIAIAATNDRSAIVPTYYEAEVEDSDGYWLSGVEIFDGDNIKIGESDWLGNFTLTFRVLEGLHETYSILLIKENYIDTPGVAHVIGGHTTSPNEPYVMREIDETK